MDDFLLELLILSELYPQLKIDYREGISYEELYRRAIREAREIEYSLSSPKGAKSFFRRCRNPQSSDLRDYS